MTTNARRWSATGMILATMVLGVATRAAAQQSTAPATTEIVRGEWSVTPFIGFGFSGDLDSATGALGVAGGYGWSPTISLEGEFNLLPSSENNGLVEVNSKAWSLAANLLYHFAPRRFRPYGVIGLGVSHSGSTSTQPFRCPPISTFHRPCSSRTSAVASRSRFATTFISAVICGTFSAATWFLTTGA